MVYLFANQEYIVYNYMYWRDLLINHLSILLYYLFLLTIQSVNAKENSLMLMITDKNCLYCIIWEKQIGKIYPKTDIAKKFPLQRIEVKNFIN